MREAETAIEYNPGWSLAAPGTPEGMDFSSDNFRGLAHSSFSGIGKRRNVVKQIRSRYPLHGPVKGGRAVEFDYLCFNRFYPQHP